MATQEAYLGTVGGFVQQTYPNQHGTWLPGDIMHGTDTNLIDSVTVAETNGVNAGQFVTKAFMSTPLREGVNNIRVSLPTATSTAIYGMVIVNRVMASRNDGTPYAPLNTMANVLRFDRAGGRGVTLAYDTIAAGDPVYVVRANAVTGNTRPIGSVTNAAITDGTNTDTLAIPGAVFVANAVAGKPAEFEARVQ